MGMTIDTVTKWLGIIRANLKVFPEVGSDKKIESLDTAISYLKDLEMYQLDYNARLKADLVVMLEDLDLQIDESASYNLEVAKVQRLIRDKINALKSEIEPQESEVENGNDD